MRETRIKIMQHTEKRVGDWCLDYNLYLGFEGSQKSVSEIYSLPLIPYRFLFKM